jgi:hypothetical protein
MSVFEWGVIGLAAIAGAYVLATVIFDVTRAQLAIRRDRRR